MAVAVTSGDRTEVYVFDGQAASPMTSCGDAVHKCTGPVHFLIPVSL